MIITLRNIGKINNASVKIEGITVIAGENDTGKSTVGKSLFVVCNSLNRMDERVKRMRISGVESEILRLRRFYSSGKPFRQLIEEIAFEKDKEVISEKLKKLFSQSDEVDISAFEFERIVKRIASRAALTDEEVQKTIIESWINAEFNGQLINVFENNASIGLTIQNHVFTLDIDQEGIDFQGAMSLDTEAIYIDDPFVIDGLSKEMENNNCIRTKNGGSHREHLMNRLKGNGFDEPGMDLDEERAKADAFLLDTYIANRRLKSVIDKVSSICRGNVVLHRGSGVYYRINGTEKELDIRNMSTGIKTFAVLKHLFQNGAIEENGVLILDEPEIHLHPEWQLVFAEIVVLLHKEYGVHVLLNTHSPYFLSAIEVYSMRHNVEDQCNYYFAKNIDERNVEIVEVTDDLEVIYKGLADPLQRLEDLRYDDK